AMPNLRVVRLQTWNYKIDQPLHILFQCPKLEEAEFHHINSRFPLTADMMGNLKTLKIYYCSSNALPALLPPKLQRLQLWYGIGHRTDDNPWVNMQSPHLKVL